MADRLLNKYEKCPQCGKKKGLFLTRDKVITDFISLSGKRFVFEDEHKRNYKLSREDLAMIMDLSTDDDPHYAYHCEYCKWYSHPFDSEGNDLINE